MGFKGSEVQILSPRPDFFFARSILFISLKCHENRFKSIRLLNPPPECGVILKATAILDMPLKHLYLLGSSDHLSDIGRVCDSSVQKLADHILSLAGFDADQQAARRLGIE